jgi:hypothetical protein
LAQVKSIPSVLHHHNVFIGSEKLKHVIAVKFQALVEFSPSETQPSERNTSARLKVQI